MYLSLKDILGSGPVRFWREERRRRRNEEKAALRKVGRASVFWDS